MCLGRDSKRELPEHKSRALTLRWPGPKREKVTGDRINDEEKHNMNYSYFGDEINVD
jgi:hypothetical protein